MSEGARGQTPRAHVDGQTATLAARGLTPHPAGAGAAPAARDLTPLYAHGLAEGAALLALAAWWLTARNLPEFVLPGPATVLATLARFATDPGLAWHLGISFARVIAAVAIAMALGMTLAMLARPSPAFAAVVERRILVILNSFPSVGWAILGVVWFGVSNLTVIFIEVAIVLPFCLANALEGFRNIDTELEEMGRSFGRSRWRRFTRLTLPLVMPFLAAGLRIVFGICWKIALVAELFGAQSGLGFLMLQAQSTANAAMVFACCFVIVIVVFAVDRLALAPLARAYSRNKGAPS
ncbi:MAG: ABC transporter permease subunit [Hyphomicrobiaceae bacterium]